MNLVKQLIRETYQAFTIFIDYHYLCLLVNLLNWQWTSRYDGDLVAKFYYANNRLVWEILDAGLKRKIEINWENISALKVICPDGGPGTLEIMV